MTIERIRAKIIEDISIMPSEVKRFFHNLPADSLPYYPSEVEVKQLVKEPYISKNQKAVIIERLKALKTRIQQGEDFAILAKEYSEDLGTAGSGGELGFWKLGELAPTYEAAALMLEPEEISEPIETEFGFHLIQLIQRKGNRYNSRHILMKPSAEVLDFDGVLNYLDSIRTVILNGDITFEKAAKTWSEDPVTAKKGGSLTNAAGSVRIPVDELPSEIFFSVDTLSPGNITTPVLFKTENGKQAARLLFLKARIDAHPINLKQDYEKICQMALNAKKATALNTWFTEVRHTIFVVLDADYQHCQLLK